MLLLFAVFKEEKQYLLSYDFNMKCWPVSGITQLATQ